MLRWLLVVRGRRLPLPIGDVVIGRASECDVVIADPVASRQHVVLHVREDGVTAEDLGSRNGTSIDGRPLVGPVELEHGSRLGIGDESLTLLDRLRAQRNDREATAMVRAMTPTSVDSQGMTALTSPSAVLDQTEQALAKGDVSGALGRVSLLARRLVAAAEQGRNVEETVTARVARALVECVRRTDDGVWLDPIFELYGACGRLLEPDTLEALSGLTTARPPSASALRIYLDRLTAAGVPHDASERARLEIIERAAARWAP